MKTKQELINLGLPEYKADEVMLLESKMLEQAVRFQFKKKDGSTREAVGTLKREKMVQEDGVAPLLTNRKFDGILWQPQSSIWVTLIIKPQKNTRSFKTEILPF